MIIKNHAYWLAKNADNAPTKMKSPTKNRITKYDHSDNEAKLHNKDYENNPNHPRGSHSAAKQYKTKINQQGAWGNPEYVAAMEDNPKTPPPSETDGSAVPKKSPSKHTQDGHMVLNKEAHIEKHGGDAVAAGYEKVKEDKKSKTKESFSKDGKSRTDKDGNTWYYTGIPASTTIGGGREGQPGEWILVEKGE